MPCLGLFKR